MVNNTYEEKCNRANILMKEVNEILDWMNSEQGLKCREIEFKNKLLKEDEITTCRDSGISFDKQGELKGIS
jgi:hypothetical protein